MPVTSDFRPEPEKTLNSFDAGPLKNLGNCTAFSVPEASSPATLDCYLLQGQAPSSAAVPGCAPTTPDPEGELPSSSLSLTARKRVPVAVLPGDMSPVHQRGHDRPAGPPGAQTALSPANPESGGQSRKRKKRGTEEMAGVSQTTTPINLNSREFMSDMKKQDRRACMLAFRGKVTGLPRLTWWLPLITSCHMEKNPLTAPDRPRPSPRVCANPQDSPHQEGPSCAPWTQVMMLAGPHTVTQVLIHPVRMLMEARLCKAGTVCGGILAPSSQSCHDPN